MRIRGARIDRRGTRPRERRWSAAFRSGAGTACLPSLLSLALVAGGGCGAPSVRDAAGGAAAAGAAREGIGPAVAGPGEKRRRERDGSAATAPAERPALPGDFESLRAEALALAAELRRRHDDAPETIDLEASMHDRFGNLAAATALWDEWLRTHPEVPEAHLRLGRYARERGDDVSALEHLRAAFDAAPEIPGAQVLLGETLTAVGRADEAIEVLSRDLPATAGNPNRLILLGHARLQQGDPAAAKADFERALQIDPASTHALYGLGTASARLGDADAAKRHLAEFARRKDRGLARDRSTAAARLDDMPGLGQSLAGWYAIAGRIAAARGDGVAAERHWLRALDFVPAQRDALEGLVERWRRQGRDDEVQRLVARARAADRRD